MNSTEKDELWDKYLYENSKGNLEKLRISRYEVFEYTKTAGQSVAMNLNELLKFCNDFNLPVFTLDVDRIAQMGLTQDLEKRYRTWFTVFQGFTFYASKYLDEKGEVKNVEGATKEGSGEES